jgi:hypothetical protein
MHVTSQSPEPAGAPDAADAERTSPEAPPADGDGTGGNGTTSDSSRRAAFVVFLLAELGALVFYGVISRPMWFYLDEWDFLAGRTAGNLSDLFRAHNEHWVTLPVLTYRALWWVFGLRTYRPYQLVIILLHLTAALLLRAVMRRAGVRPWTATIVACVLVFFGSGYQNIVYPFQMTLVGSLVFGLAQLLLATHEGRFDRRDWFALAAGCAGLLCSGIAVPMVLAVGIAVLLVRGWRMALLQTVPLAVLYVVWFAAIGHKGYTGYHADPGQIVSFVWTFTAATFGAVGHYRGVGWLLGLLLVVGLIIAWKPFRGSERRRGAALPFALLVAALALLLITAFGRAGLGTFKEKSRYLHLVAALCLPAIGVAADAVMRTAKRRWISAAVIAVLVVGIPSNVNLIINYMHGNIVTQQTAYKQMMLSLPRVAVAKQVPRDVKPEQKLAHFVTIGWMLDGVASGRIPKPNPISPYDEAIDDLRLSFVQPSGAVPTTDRCVPVTQRFVFTLAKGDRIIVRAKNSTLRVSSPTVPLEGTYPYFIITAPPAGGNLVAVRPVTFRVSAALLGSPTDKLCATPAIMNAAVAAGRALP